MSVSSFRWRRLDLPGSDIATLSSTSSGHRLSGHAQFRDGSVSVDLRYSVEIGPDWHTRLAEVAGMGPNGPLRLRIEASPDHHWRLNGKSVPGVDGCIDVDLNFTPATNLLSLRRLELQVGQSDEVVAAWLEYPEFQLRPLRQLYQRLPSNRYAYACPEIPFDATLAADDNGFVTSYPPLWEPGVK